jgi:photosystem II stability/assembly factor-like uncharacterized protein
MTRSKRLTRIPGLLAFLIQLSTVGALAQQGGSERPVNQSDDPILREFVWRSIGPANMSGRIDDVEAVVGDPSTIYLGFATGGIWKSTNMGTTWTPIFDTYPVSSVGDIAIAPSNPDILYVGSGESNNRQSTTRGDGVYKSTDGGETFMNVGLRNSHHIARVIVDPNDPDVAYVAATGPLWGPGGDRGLFKTTDGGQTWTNTNFIDEDTGFTDVVMDPRDSQVLYAASYQRRRTPWGFNGGGPGSGIWKTANGGASWTRLEGSGLPEGILGRIGLTAYAADPNIVYAQIEVPNPTRREEGDTLVDPTRSGVWRSNDGGNTWEIRSNNNNRPMYYSQIRVDPTDSDIVYTMGASFYKSVDGGKTFSTVRGMGHGDHHALWINPDNPNQLMLGTDGGFNISWDQAATWDFINTMAVGQFYEIGVDMRRPYFVCGGLQDNGSWCGPSATRAAGIFNHDWYRVGGGDGFYVRIDPTDYNVVYSESQGGSMSRRDLRTGQSQRIAPAPPRERNGQVTPGNVVPEPELGTRYRFEWNTPIELSPHDPSTVLVAGNRFFRSTDRGTTWVASRDLTKQVNRDELSIMGVPGSEPMTSKNDGQSRFSQATTLAESPSQPGVIWVGTDDGNVQVSVDGGATFTNVTDNIPGAPEGYCRVKRVEPSNFAAGTCYVVMDNHRNEDWSPYVFVTRDFGQTFTSITNNLPAGPTNVITEDPRNPNLLYLGTEFGLFVSLDRGQEWKRFQNGLPTVRIDDILVHPRENDLVVGTHGRSIWIVDDITPLQLLTPEILAGDAYLFEVRSAVQWLRDTQKAVTVGGGKQSRGSNPPAGTAISYYLPTDLDGEVTLTIAEPSGETVRTLKGPGQQGINRVQWNLRSDPPPDPEGAQQAGQSSGRERQGPPVDPGTYLVTLEVGGREMTRAIVVEEDIWMGEAH